MRCSIRNADNEYESTPYRATAVGCRANKARPVAPFRQHPRPAFLRGCGGEKIHEGKICPPLSCTARENARPQAGRSDSPWRSEPLELRRWDAVANRPLGMARSLE